MKKYAIGFNTKFGDDVKEEMLEQKQSEVVMPRKSVVKVYFPQRRMNLAYYNDSFDLKVGDIVYVDGKLEGLRGKVTEINYSFKIKLSDYHKVIAVADTTVKGDLYFAGSHMVTFDRFALSYEKVRMWFKAPEGEEEYVISEDGTDSFHIDDLGGMKIDRATADRGHEYYMQNRVVYICVDKGCGRAIVEGSEFYEIEFNYYDGEISNLVCSCYCSGACKHQFAAMLQLGETLEYIENNYENLCNDYFAAISKDVFGDFVMTKKTGRISL